MFHNKHFHGALAALTLLATAWWQPAAATLLDPNGFTSLGAFPTLTSITINTDDLSMSGTGNGALQTQGVDAYGQSLPDIAVFTFDGGVTIANNVTINVTGHNALALLFQGSATLGANINAFGGNGQDVSGSSAGLGGNGGPGTRFAYPTSTNPAYNMISGGNGSGACSGQTAGQGFGAPVTVTLPDNSTVDAHVGSGLPGLTEQPGRAYGGSGGGFGGSGGESTAYGPVIPIPGGAANGDLAVALHGGSSGGGGGGGCGFPFTPAAGGGGAGGGLEIGATTFLDLIDGIINLSGGDGGTGGDAGGGGGSGGGLLLHAFDVSIDGNAFIDASGGAPGYWAGCGGGGRVLVLHNDSSTTSSSQAEIAAHSDLSGGGQCIGSMYAGVADVTMSPSIGMTPPSGTVSVPEPPSLGLLLVGLIAVGGLRRRRA